MHLIQYIDYHYSIGLYTGDHGSRPLSSSVVVVVIPVISNDHNMSTQHAKGGEQS